MPNWARLKNYQQSNQEHKPRQLNSDNFPDSKQRNRQRRWTDQTSYRIPPRTHCISALPPQVHISDNSASCHPAHCNPGTYSQHPHKSTADIHTHRHCSSHSNTAKSTSNPPRRKAHPQWGYLAGPQHTMLRIAAYPLTLSPRHQLTQCTMSRTHPCFSSYSPNDTTNTHLSHCI